MRRWYLTAIAAGVFLVGCSSAKVLDACKSGGDVICDIQHPEDIEVVPNTRWLLTTGERDGKNMLLVDPVTKEVKPLSDGPPSPTEVETFPRCGEPPKTIGQGAFHLSAAEDGSQRLLVLNRGRVERYRVTISGDDVAAAWEGCVKIPDELAPNDIAALGDRGFVISHMFSKPVTWMTSAKFMLGLSTGAVWAWTRDGGWKRVPNSDASFANGIQVDPKTGRIYVASMFNQRIVAVNLDGSDQQTSDRLPMQNDNLSWTPDGTHLIGVGHTGIPLIGTSKCKSAAGKPCYFPFAVISVDPKTLKFETIYRDDEGKAPGASVAILKDGNIYLGTAFGERISIVKPNRQAN